MKIGLYVGQLGLRGTDQFVYTLAEVCETILSHRVLIITPQQQPLTKDVTQASNDMFRSRFFVVFKSHQDTLDDIARRYGLQLCYISKWGIPDDLVTTTIPCIVHAMFNCCSPHGDLYLAVSEYMKAKCRASCEVLPCCIQLLPAKRSLRQELDIPANAFVFGRHGGYDQFDVDFVKQAVSSFSAANADVYFLFMNTHPFVAPSRHIIFLEGDPDLQARSDFVWSCDAMVHGRTDGETFGLSCGEFSLANKPVLTTHHGDLAHVHTLQPAVFVATDKEEYLHNMALVKKLAGSPSTQRFDAYTRFSRATLAAKFQTFVQAVSVTF